MSVKSKEVFDAEADATSMMTHTGPDPGTLRAITLKRNEHGNFGFAISGPVRILGHKGHDLHFVSIVDTTAEKLGLQVGDRVLSIQGNRCAGKLLHEVVTTLQNAGDSIDLHVIHDHASMHTVVMRAWEHGMSAHEPNPMQTHSLHHLAAAPIRSSVPVSVPHDPAAGPALAPTVSHFNSGIDELHRCWGSARAMLTAAGQIPNGTTSPKMQALAAQMMSPVIAAATMLQGQATRQSDAGAGPAIVRQQTPEVPLHDRLKKGGLHNAPVRSVEITKANGSFGLKLIGAGGEHDKESSSGVFIHTVRRRGTGLLVGDMIVSITGLDFRNKSVRSAVDALSLYDDGDTVQLNVQNRLADGLALEAERLASADAWPRTVTLEDSPIMKVDCLRPVMLCFLPCFLPGPVQTQSLTVSAHLAVSTLVKRAKDRTAKDLGITIRMFAPDGVPMPFVTEMRPDGPVDTSGEIAVGDMILAVGGVPTAGLEYSDVDVLLRASVGADLVFLVKTNPELWQHVAPSSDSDSHTISALASKLEPTGKPRRVVLPKGLAESGMGFRLDGPISTITGHDLRVR